MGGRGVGRGTENGVFWCILGSNEYSVTYMGLVSFFTAL